MLNRLQHRHRDQRATDVPLRAEIARVAGEFAAASLG